MPDRPEVIALLSDCKENPEDDTPRLVLADWLEERDDLRGSFLRAQVLAARLPQPSPERAARDSEAARLLIAHEIAWLGRLRPHLEGWEFARGLVRARARPAPLLDAGALVGSELLAWVEEFRLFDAANLLARAAQSGVFDGVRALHLQYNRLGDAALSAWLTGTPHAGLQELDLFSNDLTAASLGPLARVNLPHLRRLNLGDNPLGAGVLATLAAGDRPTLLDTLQLERVGLRDPLLPQRPGAALARVQALDLSDNELAPGGLESILTRCGLPPLRQLKLRSSRLGDDVARVLVGLPDQVARLEWLSLPGCGLTDAGVEVLAACPHLAHVRTLILDGNQMTALGAGRVLHSPHLTGLRDLSLQDMRFALLSDANLLDAPRLAQLTSLGCGRWRTEMDLLARLRKRYPGLTLE